MSLVDFIHCPPLIGCRKNARKFTCLGQLPGMIIKNHRQVPVSVFRVKIATWSPLKRVMRRVLELVIL
jgi:hypothetical protein